MAEAVDLRLPLESPPAISHAPADRRSTPPQSARTAFAQHALAALGYLAVALWYLRPIWRVYATHIAPDLGDPLFNLVILKWGLHQLSLGMPDFWNAPFFFPAAGAITYSDHLLGPAVLAWSLGPLLPSALAAYNLLFFASFAGSGWSTWYVLRRAGTAPAAAFLGGLVFAFSPFRWDQLSHIQVLLMLWIPLVLWTWDRLLASPSSRRAAVFLLFYALHVSGGSYLAYMIHVPLGILLWVRVGALWRSAERGRALTVLVSTGAICLALLLAVFLPYLQRSAGRGRTGTEIAHFGATLLSYGSTGPSAWYSVLSEKLRRPENAQFAGFIPTILVLLAAVSGWRRLRSPPLRAIPRNRWWLIVGLGALALAAFLFADLRTWADARGWALPNPVPLRGRKLGVLFAASAAAALWLRRRWGGNWPLRLSTLDPWQRGLLLSTFACLLLTFPVVYLPLTQLVPGFAGMRVPARFYAFVSLGFAWFAAMEFERLRAGFSPAGRRWMTAGVTTLLLLELKPRPLEWFQLPAPAEFPAVYQWLARTPEVRATLELPVDDLFDQIRYMYFETLAWKPLVNGYSGFLAPHFEDLVRTGVRPAPSPEELARLRAWGVTHLVVHPDHLAKKRRRDRFWQWVDREKIPLVYDDGKDLVFSLVPPAAGVGISNGEPAPRR